MRIAFLLPSIRKGGPQSVVLALIEEYIKKDINVCVFYFDNKLGTVYPCETEKIKFTDFNKIKGFDILHTHGLRPDLFVFLFKQFLKVKTVSTIHSYIQDEFIAEKGKLYGKLVWFFWNFFLIRHNVIICLSNQMKNYYSDRIFNKNITYCYNSVSSLSISNKITNQDIISRIVEAKKNYSVIGNISFILKLKGLTQVIDLLKLNKQLFAVFVGDGEFKSELEEYSIKQKVNERCLFLGFQQNPKDFVPYFDVYVMPSYSEGFPMAVLEVGLFGKPVVCSNLAIYDELFSKEELVTYKVDNIDDFSNKVEFALKNSLELGLKLKEKINKSYLAKHAADNHIRIYKNIK